MISGVIFSAAHTRSPSFSLSSSSTIMIIFPSQFAGSLTGTYLTSQFARRNNFLSAAMIGSVLMAGGVLLMNFDHFSICLVGFLINGLGIGLTLPSINMLILELNPERPASS